MVLDSLSDNRKYCSLDESRLTFVTATFINTKTLASTGHFHTFIDLITFPLMTYSNERVTIVEGITIYIER